MNSFKLVENTSSGITVGNELRLQHVAIYHIYLLPQEYRVVSLVRTRDDREKLETGDKKQD